MRIFLLFFYTCFSLQSTGQLIVKNTRPEVFLDRRLVVYVGIDNPITITTGKDPTAKISVKNGILTGTGKEGKYFIRPLSEPDKYSPQITVIVKTSKEVREFVFDVIALPNTEIQFAGIRNEDGVLTNFRHMSEGIYCWIKYFEVPAEFRIDSFIVAISHPQDSLEMFLHTNKGARWDSITSEKIYAVKAGSLVTIKKVWIKGPNGSQFIQKPEIIGYIR